jgi:hypothetical protein
MEARIVRLEIIDDDWRGILYSSTLVNPDKDKLTELKHMIEERFDTDGLTDEEIVQKENFRDFIWDKVHEFISDNFIVLHVNETYEILY